MSNQSTRDWYFEAKSQIVVGYPISDYSCRDKRVEVKEVNKRVAIVEGPAIVWYANNKNEFVVGKGIKRVKQFKRKLFTRKGNRPARVSFFALDSQNKPNEKMTDWFDVPFMTKGEGRAFENGLCDGFCDYTTFEICSVYNFHLFPIKNVEKTLESKALLEVLNS